VPDVTLGQHGFSERMLPARICARLLALQPKLHASEHFDLFLPLSMHEYAWLHMRTTGKGIRGCTRKESPPHQSTTKMPCPAFVCCPQYATRVCSPVHIRVTWLETCTSAPTVSYGVAERPSHTPAYAIPPLVHSECVHCVPPHLLASAFTPVFHMVCTKEDTVPYWFRGRLAV
jgi:hypothetical protein